ncbi:putative transcription factor bZIP family [Helianthus annuus]|uniref:Transcription factor bZIP family n=3 Tax=Helianthus annuus TaxID=4232 RepID=A0A9K3J6I8_HELAN|nr:protein ABSCISIC ACID-INSENSITIVE 5 [Helianthus annuus]KAF5809771.1 putative transcription factor bZIP family [Helianthus annuus]KAJ0580741.1 putative transcription factor bZIP family [Helianthus annuus]KAJ0588413.1 putative transcription factor bZIP family [Helianthus annuus]KAJ0596689.1 putative transcription factor bZIP family [Helianthus annuus]KAJ0757359.1 putative transcription factor bZIP family [Helianthus annuus]
MVAPDTEIMSPGEVESPMQSDQHQARNNVHNSTLVPPQLGRQSSIYSLTLDEFQHTLNESGKNFGSMNMDEFLNSIWTAEENQAHTQAHPPTAATIGGGISTSAAMATNGASSSGQFLMGINANSAEPNMIARQVSLSRQGSLTLPGPLSRKTVDEVWSEIQKTRQDHQQPSNDNNSCNEQVPGAQRQPTYGEMTLEDFLVKAGVVREQNHPNAPPVPQQVPASFGLYPTNGNNRIIGPPPSSAHMVRPMLGLSTGGGASVIPPYSPLIRETPGYPGGKRAGNYQQQPPPYGGIGGNAGGVAGGYGQGLGIGSPPSPVSSDGIATTQLDSGNQYALEMGGIRGGRKRIIDGPVEKVVERRQRRMIKNRESAARSRARKQAYTVELEAELNMLKEENAQLKQALAEIERKRKQQFSEEIRMKGVTKCQKVRDKSRMLRRTSSCPT